MRYVLHVTLHIMLITACSGPHNRDMTSTTDFDIQGHRGCRGLLPENSIPGFLYALELGATTLEMDVVISQDLKVVVSHEPFMSHLICSDSTGGHIPADQEHTYNIFQMDYQQIRQFDCGSRQHPNYPEQRVMTSFKPLLSEVLSEVEKKAQELGIDPPYYNIETKSHPSTDHQYHPGPDQFVNLLLEVVRQARVQNRLIIQSFDPRTLQAAKKQAPNIALALLVENRNTPRENLDILGFQPQIYSPEHVLVTGESLDYLQGMGVKVIPWTINDPEDMQAYMDLGVDGIITDYPDRLLRLMEKQ